MRQTEPLFRAARFRLPFAIGALLLCPGLHAQTAGAVDRVRSINQQLSGNTLPARDTERVLSERALALYSLMDSDPAAALAMALPAQEIQSLHGAVPEHPERLEASGTWRGPAIAVVEEDSSGGPGRTGWRIRIAGESVQLYFPGAPPQLACERELQVEGMRLGNRLVASSATFAGPEAPTCNTGGTPQTATLLVAFPGTAPPTVQAGSDAVFGPFTLDANYACDDLQGIQNAAIRAADSAVDLTRYGRIRIIHSNAGCQYAAAHTVGAGLLASPSRGPFTASVVWQRVPTTPGDGILASLTFRAPAGSQTKQTRNVRLGSDGPFSVSYSAPQGTNGWLTVSAAESGSPSVTVDPTGLATGVYQAAIATSLITVPVTLTVASGAAGYWPFDAATIVGNVVLDESGNGLNGTLVNALSVPGVVNEALTFTGTNSYVAVPDSAGTELTHDLTIATWIRTQNNSQVQDFIGKYDYTGNETGYLLQVLPSGVVNLHLGGYNIQGSRDITDTTPINDGQWHHVAVVIGLGQSVLFYIDGKLSSTVTRPVFAAGTSATLYLGTSPGALNGQPFTGSLDEVQIYSRQLSATDILLLTGGAVPVITSISPTSTPQATPVTITVTGSGFLPSARVAEPDALRFSPSIGFLSTTYVSSTQLTAVVNRNFLQGPGSVPLQVFNVYPGGVGSNIVNLTVTPVVPTITSLSPSSITAGSPDFTLTVNGTGLVPPCTCDPDPLLGAAIFWNGTQISTLFNDGGNSTSTSAVIPASLVANPGTATITVVNPGNIVSNPLTFTINPATPQLTLLCEQTTGPSQVGIPYSNACTVNGGTMPYSWSISVGSLPPGLSLTVTPNTGGVIATISGTPTTMGSYSYTLTVTDSSTPTHKTASQSYSGTIASGQGGLAGYWTCDTADITGNTMLDRSGNGLNATLVNTTSAPGRVNQALCFNGANSYASIPDSPGLRLSHDLTLATWVKTTNNTQTQDFLSKYDFTGQETGYILQMLPNGTVNLHLGGNNVISGGRDGHDNTVINDGQWHYVAVVIPVGGHPQFYIDGVPTTTTAQVVAAAGNSSPLYLGTFPDAYNGLPYVGCLDEVRIYSRQLSAAEISALATATGPLITSVSPTTTPEGSGFTVTVNGSGFAPNSQVLIVPQAFNGIPPELMDLARLNTTFVSPNQLTAVVPRDFTVAPGYTIMFQVFNGPTNGTGSNTMGVTVTPLVPTITRINPSSATAGGGSFTLTVFGTNFISPCACLPDPEPGATVYWNGTALFTTWINSNQLTAMVPANLIATAGTATITVSNIGGIVSNPATFDVIGGGAPLALNCTPRQFVQPNVPFTASCTATGGVPPYQFVWNDEAPFPTISGNVISFTFTLNQGLPLQLIQVGVNDSRHQPFLMMFLVYYTGDYLSPAGSWPFDTVVNGLTPDYSGNNLPGTVTNATLVPGAVNQALSFSGAGSYVTIPESDGFELTHDLTLATWIKTTNNTQKQDFLSKYDFTGAESGYMLQMLPSGVVNLRIGGSNLLTGSHDVTDTSVINDGQWHHVAVVITLGQSVSFYIDGKLSSTQPLATSAWRNLMPVFAGTFPNAYNGLPFVGALDELRIFSRALTAAEVLALFQAPN